MTGGGWSKGGGVPLRDRVRVGGPRPSLAPTAGQPPGQPLGQPCPARHCWVADAVDGDGEKRPGLLVEWRQAGSGWEGRVIYVARVRDRSWALVEEWLPQELLAPV
jgi:hypothetical protein